MPNISPSTARMINALYQHIHAARESAIVDEWFSHWQLVHGELERKRTVDRSRLAAAFQLSERSLDLRSLLYAVEIYLVFRMRLHAWLALNTFVGAQKSGCLLRARNKDIQIFLRALFSEDSFARFGISNYASSALFWPALDALSSSDVEIIRQEIISIVEIQPDVSEVRAKDIFRAIYHDLVPKQARHSLGSYYTPSWLSEYVLEHLWKQVGHRPIETLRLLDPACGSGTFLIQAMQHLFESLRGRLGAADMLRLLLRNVVGFDIDPIAVTAAQTNIILFIARLLSRDLAREGTIELPVYLFDSIYSQQSPAGAPFDIVAGNPPWVNWEYLPPHYRDHIQHLWQELGLFDLKGKQRAFSKEDISVLFAYVACDRYLSKDGCLGFVMPQSLFKSSLNGQGFRRFRIGAGGADLKVVQVDDLVDVRPFEGVANRTSVLFLQKGAPTQYPVPYRRWQVAAHRRSIPEEWAWAEVSGHVAIREHHAIPTDLENPASYWMDGPAEALRMLPRLTGACPYRARTGMFTGGANGVFYVELLERLPDGNLRVRNMTERAKRAVPSTEAVIEPTFVFPQLRGRDVGDWSYAVSSHVLCPHTASTKMRAVAPAALRAQAPRTFSYLEQFREILKQRRGFAGWEQRFLADAFYACQRIGEYTFAPYKVVWRYISPAFRCCVVAPAANQPGANQVIIPHEKLMVLAFDDALEAYYVCGVLSSAPARFFVESRMVETQIAPHVISQLAIPPFDKANPLHVRVAELCRRGHAANAAVPYQEQIDAMIHKIFPITAEEVLIARRCLPA
jgi:hypothetical protein